jgi:regulator of protease activity HflC (stomatin/prohibitin superfamily)
MIFLSKKTVFEGFAGLHFHKGKLAGTLAPGEHWLYGAGHRVITVDKRPQSTQVGGQEVSTSDGGAFRISLIFVHQIEDPELNYRSGMVQSQPSAAVGWGAGMVAGPDRLRQMVQIAVREWVMTRTFREVYEQRGAMVSDILPALATAAKAIGFEVLSIDLLDITAVGGLRSALFDLLKTQLEGEAALARARNESSTMRSLLNTARLVREHPKLLELRVLASGQKPRVTFVVGSEPASSVGESAASPEEP